MAEHRQINFSAAHFHFCGTKKLHRRKDALFPFHSGKANQAGFTLIEVIIVLGIVAIMCLVVFSSLILWRPNFQLNAATRELYGNFQKAKLHAVKTNQKVTFNFTVSNAACATPSSYVFKDTDGKVVASASMPADGVCVASFTGFVNNTSGFNQKGQANDTGGRVQLRHAKLDSRVREVIQSVAGSVRVE